MPTNSIEHRNLAPHPEGGFYRELYRSPLLVSSPHGKTSAASAIYFLLRTDDVSQLHRLKNDEIWCWHEGGSANVHMIAPDGTYQLVQMGPDSEYTVVIPAGTWFGATVTGSHVLMTAIVAPGFDFQDFELADRVALIKQHPQHHRIIKQLTSDE